MLHERAVVLDVEQGSAAPKGEHTLGLDHVQTLADEVAAHVFVFEQYVTVPHEGIVEARSDAPPTPPPLGHRRH